MENKKNEYKIVLVGGEVIPTDTDIYSKLDTANVMGTFFISVRGVGFVEGREFWINIDKIVYIELLSKINEDKDGK